MADSLKQFPASDIKLDKLRRQGIVPISEALNSVGIFIGLGLALAVLSHFFADNLLAYWISQFSSVEEQVSPTSDLLISIAIASKIIFVGLTLIAIPFFLLGWIQNKMLIAFGALSINFLRIVNFSNLGASKIISSISLWLMGLFIGLAWLGLAVAVLYQGLLSLQSLLDSLIYIKTTPRELLTESSVVLVWVFMALMIFSITFGVISRIFAVMSFKKSQQMSRSEVDAEFRESEMSPELKRALRRS